MLCRKKRYILQRNDKHIFTFHCCPRRIECRMIGNASNFMARVYSCGERTRGTEYVGSPWGKHGLNWPNMSSATRSTRQLSSTRPCDKTPHFRWRSDGGKKRGLSLWQTYVILRTWRYLLKPHDAHSYALARARWRWDGVVCDMRGFGVTVSQLIPGVLSERRDPRGPSFTADNTRVHTASVVPTDTQARVCVCVCVSLFYMHACSVATFVWAFCWVLFTLPTEPFCCNDQFHLNVFSPPFQSSDLQHTAFLCLILTCQPPAIVCPWLATFSLSSSCVYWSHL